MRGLLLEDDVLYAKNLAELLKKNGITCDVCHFAEEAISMSDVLNYDIILADIGLPDMSGNEFIKRIRISKDKQKVPIIVLSVLNHPNQKVESFTLGADDFVSKPYEQKELLSRIQALVRRSRGYTKNKFIIGEMILDMDAKIVTINQKRLKLTNKEYFLLEFLILRKGSPVSKLTIIDHLYGLSHKIPTNKIIDVLICRIRNQITKFTDKKYLHTDWGLGYSVGLKDEYGNIKTGESSVADPAFEVIEES